uniref:Uncharacterized protein n=1 Tax=Timema cristinae TaxID=61476 RepID=A0A7R9DNM3_TIMCR|nr:unnamed protein product [Timema cristinae]
MNEERHGLIKVWSFVPPLPPLFLQLLCCGTDGPADYRRHGVMPWSCCDDTASSSPQHAGGGCTHVHQTGCLSRLTGFLEARILETSLAAVAAVLIQSAPKKPWGYCTNAKATDTHNIGSRAEQSLPFKQTKSNGDGLTESAADSGAERRETWVAFFAHVASATPSNTRSAGAKHDGQRHVTDST